MRERRRRPADRSRARPRIRVGTSGYAYPAWKGTFYPADLPASRFFEHYASRFDTVELNSTYYRLPSTEAVAAWAAAAPPGFTYALKASQRITHQKRLKDASEPVARLWDVTAGLGAARGPILFGLPPNMRKDVPRLRDFLAILPREGRAAFEFRHASWFDDEVFEALRSAGAALCVADSDDLATPLVATAPWGYARLRRAGYAGRDLGRWAERLLDPPWEEAFVYLKHEESGRGPALASLLLRRLGGSAARVVRKEARARRAR